MKIFDKSLTRWLTIALIIFASSALVSCANSQPTKYTDGKVVDCNSINRASGTGVELLCIGDGSVTNIDSLRGPMILNVWGTWCEPCRDELPLLRKFYDQYNDQVQLVGLNVEELHKDLVKPFIRANGIVWPSLYDPDGRTRKLIGMGVPVTWFIDEDGKTIHKKIGAFLSYEELKTLAQKYFNLQ